MDDDYQVCVGVLEGKFYIKDIVIDVKEGSFSLLKNSKFLKITGKGTLHLNKCIYSNIGYLFMQLDGKNNDIYLDGTILLKLD